jgi:hypothetical protein
LARAETCAKCRADARCCLNCQFFDASAYRNCRETQAEWVKEKNQGNFCGYFQPSDKVKVQSKAAESLDKLSNLFNSKTSSEKPKTSSIEDDLKAFLNKK